MNFVIVVAIGTIIIVTRLASWAQKQQRIAQGRLPSASDDPARPEGLLDVLRDLDQQLGQTSGRTVQTRVPGPRPPVTTAVRGGGVPSRRGPLGEPLDANRGSRGPLGESLGGRGGAFGPLGEPLGAQARRSAPVAARPVGLTPGLPTRVPGQVPARRGETGVAGNAHNAREDVAAKPAASRPVPAVAKLGARPSRALEVGVPKIEHPKGTDPAAGGRRLAHALLQTNDGRQAAVILTEIFGPPVGQR